MRILLVGGSSSLALALEPELSRFATVVIAGRTNCELRIDLASEVDIPDGFDVVVNAAASFAGSTPEEFIATEDVNALGVLRLCRACTRARTGRLVQVSSTFAQLDPASPFYGIYSLSKKHADDAAGLYAKQFGLELLIVAPSQMYGVGEAYRRNQPFLYRIIDRAQAGEDIEIFGSNDALRNFIHVDDVAATISLAIQAGLSGRYSCAYPENVTYSQIAKAAVEAFGSTSRVTFRSERPDIPDNAFDRDDALFRAIGRAPQVSIAEGVRREAEFRRKRA